MFGLSQGASISFIWIVIIFMGISVFWTVKAMTRRNYPFRVLIHSDLQGTGMYPITSEDRARLIPISKDGTKLLWLRKNKIARPYYGNFSGNKTLTYVVVKGNWFSGNYSGIDTKLKEIGIEPMDIQSQKLVGQTIKILMDGQFPDKKVSRMMMFMVAGIILTLAVSGFILYKNIAKSNESVALNLENSKLQQENIIAQQSAQLNFTESIKDVIAQLYQVGGGSGGRPA